MLDLATSILFPIIRTLRLAAMSGNTMISRSADQLGAPPLRNVRQYYAFTICRSLRPSAVSGNIMFLRSAGHSTSSPWPVIVPFPHLPDTPAIRYVRKYYAFTICRTLDLSSMSCNIMLSRFAGHSGSPQCPAILCFHDLPVTPPLRHVRQYYIFTIC